MSNDKKQLTTEQGALLKRTLNKRFHDPAVSVDEAKQVIDLARELIDDPTWIKELETCIDFETNTDKYVKHIPEVFSTLGDIFKPLN